MMADRVVTMLSSMVIGVWMIRTLGPARFGTYSYALAYHSLFQIAVVWGLPSLLVKNLVRHPLERQKILGAAFYAHSLGSLLAMGFMLATAYASENNNVRFMLLVLSFSYPFTVWSILDAQYQVTQQRHRLAKARMMATGMGSLLKAAGLVFDADLYYYASVLTLENVFICVIIFIRHGETPWRERTWDGAWLRQLSVAGTPLFIQSVLILLIYRCDQFLIEHWLGKEALGEYVMGRKLPDAWCFVPGLVITTIYPQLEKSSLDALWTRAFRGLMILCMVMALLVTLFQDPLYALVFGRSLPNSATVMSVQFWVVLFTAWSMLSSHYFLSMNLQRHLITRSLAALLINVMLNILLIPKMGIVGAAVATLAAEMYMATVSCWWSSKTRGVFKLMLRALNPWDWLRS